MTGGALVVMGAHAQQLQHCVAIDQTLSTAHTGVFLPRRERDLFYLDPAPVVYGDLDPNYTGLLFLDSSLETPDLESILADSVPEDIKRRVLLAIGNMTEIKRT